MLGAIGVAKFPDGTLAQSGEMFRGRLVRIGRRGTGGNDGATIVATPADLALERPMAANTAAVVEGEPVVTTETDTTRASPTAEAPTDAVLTATGITVRFGGLAALSDVSIEVPPGTIVGLVGPNGAGKSTMFAVLSGLLRPASGRVLLHGDDVTTASPQLRARRGLARTFQQPELFMGLTVREHVVLAHRVRYSRQRLWRDMIDPRSLRPASKDENERVDGILELLNLTRVAKSSVGALPLGTSRLVEVARALATRPDVMLLDEPLSGLDLRESENARFSLSATRGDRRTPCIAPHGRARRRHRAFAVQPDLRARLR